MIDAQKLVDGLFGFTPGPWSVDPMPGVDGKHDVWTGWNDLICENARFVNAHMIADAPDLHAAVVALLADNAKLRDALQSIRQYGSDTISGPSKASDDTKSWVRDGVIEMTERACAALEETK